MDKVLLNTFGGARDGPCLPGFERLVQRADGPWSPASPEAPPLPLLCCAILDQKALDLSELRFPYLSNYTAHLSVFYVNQ